VTKFYSLLLGVDEEKKQIACGLVDTIGIPSMMLPTLVADFF
jgi:hypothetical protein